MTYHNHPHNKEAHAKLLLLGCKKCLNSGTDGYFIWIKHPTGCENVCRVYGNGRIQLKHKWLIDDLFNGVEGVEVVSDD